MSLETCLILDFEANKKQQRINKNFLEKYQENFNNFPLNSQISLRKNKK